MRVFIAGAGGAIGRRLVPLLVSRGHEVTATTRSADKADALAAAGARPVTLDLLDRDAVIAAILRAEPDVVVHEATALAGMGENLRAFDRTFAATNRLRTEGTDHLLAAARAAGTKRFVAQSYAGWPYAREGTMVKAEDAPLDPRPPRAMRQTLAAIRHLEDAVTGAPDLDGIVLRYGGFYGPGTSLERDGVHLEAVRRRRFPLVGAGTGVWSFVHIDDAAAATAAAIEHGHPGIYNIVDDDPAPVSAWLPALAAMAGAKPPRHVPTWLARLVAGEAGVAMLTEIRGASNAKARRELGWTPEHPSWREGFAAAIAGEEPSRPWRAAA